MLHLEFRHRGDVVAHEHGEVLVECWVEHGTGEIGNVIGSATIAIVIQRCNEGSGGRICPAAVTWCSTRCGKNIRADYLAPEARRAHFVTGFGGTKERPTPWIGDKYVEIRVPRWRVIARPFNLAGSKIACARN